MRQLTGKFKGAAPGEKTRGEERTGEEGRREEERLWSAGLLFRGNQSELHYQIHSESNICQACTAQHSTAHESAKRSSSETAAQETDRDIDRETDRERERERSSTDI